MDIPDKAQREWLAAKMEPILNAPRIVGGRMPQRSCSSSSPLRSSSVSCTRVTSAKSDSASKAAKRSIPLMNTLIDDGATLGVDEVVMGMAHRGRLNVLAHVLNKPYETILSEFEGTDQSQHR